MGWGLEKEGQGSRCIKPHTILLALVNTKVIDFKLEVKLILHILLTLTSKFENLLLLVTH